MRPFTHKGNFLIVKVTKVSRHGLISCGIKAVNNKQYKDPLTAVPFVSMTVLPNFPGLYREFLCV